MIVAFRSAKGIGNYRRLAATAYSKAPHIILYANQDKSHLVQWQLQTVIKHNHTV